MIRHQAHASPARVTLGFAALAVSGACPHSWAAQWSVEPQLAWLVNYNSNVLLTTTDQRATPGMTLSLDAIFKRLTDNTEMDFHPHLDVLRFSDDKDLNANNGSLQGLISGQSERSSITFTGGYERASTLTTEFTDTGIIDTNTERQTSSASVVMGHDVSELQHLDLKGSYTYVVYPGGEPVGLLGYRYPQASLTDTFTFSVRDSLSVGVLADQLTAPQSGYQARDLGMRVTLKHDFSLRTVLSASVGLTDTTIDSVRQHGNQWDLHLTHNSQLTQWDFDYGQTLAPSGRGYLVRRDTANLTLSRNLAPRWYATLTVQDVRNSSLTDAPFLDVPRYLAVDGGFDWHLSTQLVLSLTAGVVEIHEPVTEDLARGWHTGINARWTPVPLSVSR
jgi:hypothetical protein